jgi:hypothetical protein
MIICVIGLSLILFSILAIIFFIIVDKKTSFYMDKIHYLNNDIGTDRETFLTHNNLTYYRKKKKFWDKLDLRSWYQTDAIFGLLIAIIALVLFLLFAGSKSEGSKDYKEYLLVKESIEYCLDNDITLDNNLLVRSIEINSEVQKHKDDKQNPWLSWFVYNNVSEVELIDLNIFK